MQAEERHAACAGGGDEVPKGDELAERHGGESTVWPTGEDLRLHVSDHGGGDGHQLVYKHHARPQRGRGKGESISVSACRKCSRRQHRPLISK